MNLQCYIPDTPKRKTYLFQSIPANPIDPSLYFYCSHQFSPQERSQSLQSQWSSLTCRIFVFVALLWLTLKLESHGLLIAVSSLLRVLFYQSFSFLPPSVLWSYFCYLSCLFSHLTCQLWYLVEILTVTPVERNWV